MFTMTEQQKSELTKLAKITHCLSTKLDEMVQELLDLIGDIDLLSQEEAKSLHTFCNEELRLHSIIPYKMSLLHGKAYERSQEEKVKRGKALRSILKKGELVYE